MKHIEIFVNNENKDFIVIFNQGKFGQHSERLNRLEMINLAKKVVKTLNPVATDEQIESITGKINLYNENEEEVSNG